MDVSNIMDFVSDLDLRIDKSIPHPTEEFEKSSGSLKRHISKTQIQWKEVPEKAEEEKRYVKTSFPFLGLIASHGNKWQYIHEPMFKVRWDESKSVKQNDEEAHIIHSKAYTHLIRDIGSEALQKRFNKNTDLSLEQQTHLEILKQRVKAENEAYLSRHLEVGVMIKLVYAALFKNQPEHPKHFISDYVHHLNTHREELVAKDVDIPFDQPPVAEESAEEITTEEKERREISEFARKIVENCLNLATHGESYVDVMSIINSMLNVVSPSEDEVSVTSTVSSAEAAVSDILKSLLTSVVIATSTSAEIVADEVLHSILSTALPFVSSGSQVYLEMKESVESFIHSIIDEITDNFWNRITLNEILSEDLPENDIKIKPESVVENEVKRTILRKEFQEEDRARNELKYKVKFQSIKQSMK